MNKIYRFVKAESINDTSKKGGIFFVAFSLVFLVFGGIFLLDFLIFRKYNWDDGFMVIIPLVFFVIGCVGVCMGIKTIAKQKQKNEFETNLLKSCQAVIGEILDYECIEKKHHTKNSTWSSYHVSLVYRYTNAAGEEVIKSYKNSFGTRPALFKGSRIMVAINGDDSLILKSYVLEKYSEIALDNQIKLFDEQNFEDLDQGEINVDVDSIKYSSEFSHVMYWGGIALIIFAFVVFLPILIVLWVMIDILVARLIFVGIMLAVAVSLIGKAVHLIIMGRNSYIKEKRILSDCKFARANYNIPTTVFSEKHRQYCTFCFIDCEGKKRTHKITSPTAEILLDQNARGIAAYTKHEAILLIDYQIKP